MRPARRGPTGHRLAIARAQAQRPLDVPAGLSRFQAAALTTHIAELDHASAELPITGNPDA
ncbi:hypothetical protein [Streptomyces lydicus]|uniref:hypothetical protein n=1 Tax=Streptomyces lydicus TaxID=47763 RepID=UPI000C1A3C43